MAAFSEARKASCTSSASSDMIQRYAVRRQSSVRQQTFNPNVNYGSATDGGRQPSLIGLPSSSQFAATFLLGWTRGGSPGIFG